MSSESGEEVDKEVDRYNEPKHPQWALLVFHHLMRHLSPYRYFLSVHALASKTVYLSQLLGLQITETQLKLAHNGFLNNFMEV